MYLLDANVFITAANTYYALDIFPAFWSWLADAASNGVVGTLEHIRDEVTTGTDENLNDWMTTTTNLDLEPDDEAVSSMRQLANWAWNRPQYRDSAKLEFLDSPGLLPGCGCPRAWTCRRHAREVGPQLETSHPSDERTLLFAAAVRRPDPVTTRFPRAAPGDGRVPGAVE